MNAIQERLNELRQENADLKEELCQTQIHLAQLQELVDVLRAQEFLVAVGKAKSALRFQAAYSEWHTDAAREEFLKVAATLTELEDVLLKGETE